MLSQNTVFTFFRQEYQVDAVELIMVKKSKFCVPGY